MNDSYLSETVRILMARHRETTAAIGNILGVTGPAVSQRLLGNTRWSVEELVLLSRHYGLPPSDLLSGPTHALGALDNPPINAA